MLVVFRRKDYVVSMDARPLMEVVQQEIRQKLGLPPLKPSELMSRELTPEEARSA